MISEVIYTAAKAGVHLYLKDGRLAYKARSNVLTDELRVLIFDNKVKIIEFLTAQKSAVLPNIKKIMKVDHPQFTLPMSFAQQRLWLLDQIDGGSTHYNLPSTLKLIGALNVEALNLAFSSIFERHESLRTCFVAGGDGQPLQIIQTAVPFIVPFIDLSKLDENTRQFQLAHYASENADSAFNLSCDLMLRAQLLKIADDEHIIFVTMHHIASDGWSMSILINELRALYSAYVQGRPSPLTPIEIQYADYAHWQLNWLQGEVLDQQLNYWATQLAGLPVLHSLPLDHTRPAQQSFIGNTYRSQVDAITNKTLNNLCLAQGATLFMGLHATFSALLSRYSNETDIVIGSPIANREQAEIAGLIGFFVNTLILRSDLSESPSFIALIDQSKNMLLDAYAHQQVPFEKIVERLQPERNLSHNALFQIMLVLQNNEQGALELPGLTLMRVGQKGAGSAKFDLTLNVTENEEGLWLDWEYSTDLFEQDTIARMANHFELLLKSLLSRPEESVFKADMLSEPERQQLLVEWNNTTVDYPKDKCIHELFESQVTNNPDAIAVIFEDKQLSYGELNTKANQLAHYLINEKQVKPDTLVGICVERSLEMVIGILAILKAGGAYVPLDPEYPEARLAYMLDDAKLTTVLTQCHLRLTTPVNDAQAICLDDETLLQQLATQSTVNPQSAALGLTSSHLAYVIYTSGSTGNPKAVEQTHQTISNLIQGLALTDGINQPLKTLQFASSSFDVSIQEIATSWYTGSILVVISQKVKSNLIELPKVLIEHSIERLFLPPAVLQWLSETIHDSMYLSSLKEIFAAGEALVMTDTLSAFLHVHSDCRLWNHYGPTETHVATRYCTTKNVGKVPIGVAVPNMQIFILNTQMQLVPNGVPGELHIGGVGLARGYLNRPELSAEKFIVNPFYDESNSASSKRLYKTGDLVRWLPDGNLEYLGRIDHQVKIRGFRIELGEIENALTTHEDVKDVVVLAKESASGDKRLVAYVVTDVVEAVDESEESVAARHDFIEILRQHLSIGLPDYMIPSAFVFLHTLPLTPNGKVDRKALPEPDVSQQQAIYIAPRTETEVILCEIWQDVLGVERVGITDNFFMLGGNSLTAMRFVAKAREKELSYSIRQIFNKNTIIDLAAVAELSTIYLINQAPVVGKVPLSSAQQWFLGAIKINPNRGDISLFLELPTIDIAILKQTFWRIFSYHDALRAKFTCTQGVWTQTLIAPDEVNVSVEEYDISSSSLMEQIQIIDHLRIDLLQAGINISQAPLINTQVFNRGEDKGFILRCSIHHLLIDGFSMSVIQEDIQNCYIALSLGQEYTFPLKTLSFSEWQATLIAHANSVHMNAEMRYWLDLPWHKIKPIPIDYDNSSDKRNLGSFVTLENHLAHDETSALLQSIVGTLKIPVIDILIGVLVQAMAHANEATHQVIKVVDSGRDIGLDVDLSRTVGWIAISRILMLAVEKDHVSSIATIQNIHQHIQQIPNKGLGFELLNCYHKDTSVREQMSTLPKPEILLNYHGVITSKSNGSVFMNEYACHETQLTQFDPNNETHEKLICNASILNGELKFSWQYSKHWHSEKTIRIFINDVLARIQSLARFKNSAFWVAVDEPNPTDSQCIDSID